MTETARLLSSSTGQFRTMTPSTPTNETRRPVRRLRYLPTSGWLLVVHRIASTLVYTLIRFLFVVVQRLYWQLNGTTRHLRQVASDPAAYENSVHVVDILYYHSFNEMAFLYPENFIYVHNRFDSPQFIVDNDHVTLFRVDEKHAVFIEANEADQHLWRSEYAPFSKVAHALYGRRLLFVPIHVFHRMSNALGNMNEGLVIIYNTARCGSTLITQVFESTGRCVAISEPGALDYVGECFKKHGDSAELRQLAHDVIRWICRPYKTFKPLCYVVKPMAGYPETAKMLKEIFPQVHLLFMYREYTAVVKSLNRTSYQGPYLYVLLLLEKMSRVMTKQFLNELKVSEFRELWQVDERYRFGTLLTAVLMKTFLDLRREGLPVFAVRYEDLVNDPLHICQQLMKVCGLPKELAEKAVLALGRDSQRDSPFARTELQRFPELKLTEDSRKSLNVVLAKVGLPLIGSDTILEGSLGNDLNSNQVNSDCITSH